MCFPPVLPCGKASVPSRSSFPALLLLLLNSLLWFFFSHLSDPTHRETYESAHSVVLSIFASYAQRQQQCLSGNRITRRNQTLSNKSKHKQQNLATKLYSAVIGPEASIQSEDESSLSATFIQRMIPFYSSCLIDVSAPTHFARSMF